MLRDTPAEPPPPPPLPLLPAPRPDVHAETQTENDLLNIPPLACVARGARDVSSLPWRTTGMLCAAPPPLEEERAADPWAPLQ